MFLEDLSKNDNIKIKKKKFGNIKIKYFIQNLTC